MATHEDVHQTNDIPSSLVHRWAVDELQRLSFTGDCNALAQYVEILIENYNDSENYDMDALRDHVRTDLVDFIGVDLAQKFSNGLIQHLSKEPRPTNLADASESPRLTSPAPPTASANALPQLGHSGVESPQPKATAEKTPTVVEPSTTMQAANPVDTASIAVQPAQQASIERQLHSHVRHSQGSSRDRDRRENLHHDRRPDRDRYERPVRERYDHRDRPNTRAMQSHYRREDDHLPSHSDNVNRPVRPSVMDRLGERTPSSNHPPRDRGGTTHGNFISRYPSRMSHPEHTGSKSQDYQRFPNSSDHNNPENPLQTSENRNREYVTRQGIHASKRATYSPTRTGSMGRRLDSVIRTNPSQPFKRPRDENDQPSRDIDGPLLKRRSGEGAKLQSFVAPASPKGSGGISNVPSGLPTPHVSTSLPVPPPLPRPPHHLPSLEQIGASGVSWPFAPEMLGAMGLPPFLPVPSAPFPPHGPPKNIPVVPPRAVPFGSKPHATDGMKNDMTKRPTAKTSTAPNAKFSKHRHFILLAKNIPPENLMVGPIVDFFQRFGNILDVVKSPPSKAFILFENRDSASAALRSVEAVMGNRHIWISWARDSDFTEAGLSVTEDGKLVEGTAPAQANATRATAPPVSTGLANKSDVTKRKGAVTQRNGAKETGSGDGGKHENGTSDDIEGEQKTNTAGSKSVPNEAKVMDPTAAADDLKKKREKIAAMRKEQEAQRMSRKERYNELIQRQKDLFAKVQNCTSPSDKVKLMEELRNVQKLALQVREEIKPSAPLSKNASQKPAINAGPNSGLGVKNTSAVGMMSVGGSSNPSDAEENGPPSQSKYGRNLSTFNVDNRPKVLLVTGSTTNITEALVTAVFRDTKQVLKVDEGWLIELSSRRAAESAVRAIGPLKRSFGPDAQAQIVARKLVSEQPATSVSMMGRNGGDSFVSQQKNLVNPSHASGLFQANPVSGAQQFASATRGKFTPAPTFGSHGFETRHASNSGMSKTEPYHLFPLATPMNPIPSSGSLPLTNVNSGGVEAQAHRAATVENDGDAMMD